ncbi:MAG: SUMF1/EgtB/PvdO family nonheme iron enzyme [Treponema sp.]|nr:SUMF1/EgtB/PvdO family nonheme iron enzyme [Treponema sp.]
MRLRKFLLMITIAFIALGTAFAFEQKRVIVSPITGSDTEAQKRADVIFGALKDLVSKQKIVHLVNRSDIEKILSEMGDQQSGNFEKVEQVKKISNAEWIIFGNLAFDSVSSVYNLTLEMVDLSANTIATARQSESKGSNSLNNLLEKAVEGLFDPPKPNGKLTIEQAQKSKSVKVSWKRPESDKLYEYKVVYSDDPDDLINPYSAEDDAEEGTKWISSRKATFEVPDENETYYFTVLVRNTLGVRAMYEVKTSTGKVVKEATTTSSTANSSTTTSSTQSIKPDFKLVEGGTFQMGDSDEKPVHTVTVSSFYMCDHEVTQKEYRDVMGTNPSRFSGDNRPVECVSWYNAVEYCNKLSIKEGLTPCYTINGSSTTCNFKANGYRLPTEAEWEYAARGGKKSNGYTYAGSNDINSVAWYTSNTNDTSTRDVKTKTPNELGLYDMSGNVWEWCWDWKGSYSSGSQTDPVGASSGSYRVARGGSWYNRSSGCRVANRGNSVPSNTNYDVGFRVVRNASK